MKHKYMLAETCGADRTGFSAKVWVSSFYRRTRKLVRSWKAKGKEGCFALYVF